jgi:hypothetical protein
MDQPSNAADCELAVGGIFMEFRLARTNDRFIKALRLVAITALVGWWTPPGIRAEQGKLIECHWNTLPPLFGKQIVLLLPDGTHLGGEVREVMNDGLHLLIKSSSDPSTHPRGITWIPRAHIHEIEVRKKVRAWKSPEESILARWGMFLGGYLGAVRLGLARESEAGVYTGLIAGGAAGAYAGGKIAGALDPREDVNVIRILRNAVDYSVKSSPDTGPMFGQLSTGSTIP